MTRFKNSKIGVCGKTQLISRTLPLILILLFSLRVNAGGGPGGGSGGSGGSDKERNFATILVRKLLCLKSLKSGLKSETTKF